MTKAPSIILASVIIFSLFVPLLASAQLLGPIINCGFDTQEPFGEITEEEQCGWEDLIQSAQNAINFLVALSFFIAVGLFSYAGILYVTAGGESGKLDKAHKIFRATVVGFIIVLGAWLIVNFVLSALGAKSGFDLLS